MAMVDAFLDTARRSGMHLTLEDQNEYISEMVKFAVLVGIPESITPNNVDMTQKYFESILPELSASDDAKRAALFIALPPLPPLLRFGTPIAPIWGGLTSLAAASLPKWAKRLYGWPTIPGEEGPTDLALKTARVTLSALPKSFRESPQLKAARARMNQAS
jgi:uncharacterized protein (DUF2236 family)